MKKFILFFVGLYVMIYASYCQSSNHCHKPHYKLECSINLSQAHNPPCVGDTAVMVSAFCHILSGEFIEDHRNYKIEGFDNFKRPFFKRERNELGQPTCPLIFSSAMDNQKRFSELDQRFSKAFATFKQKCFNDINLIKYIPQCNIITFDEKDLD